MILALKNLRLRTKLRLMASIAISSPSSPWQWSCCSVARTPR